MYFTPHYILSYRKVMTTPRFIWLVSLRLLLQFLQRERHSSRRIILFAKDFYHHTIQSLTYHCKVHH